MTDKIALIDGDSLIYYEAFKEQTLEEAVYGIDKRLSHMLKEVGATKYIGYLTTTKCFRYKVAKAKGYKSGRVAEKPELFPGVRAHLLEKLNFYVVDGLEADDLVVYWNRNMPENTVICSPDKDVLKQTSGRHYDYRWDKESMGRFVETTPSEAVNFLWKQTLMGDSTDAIPGIPKVGEKTAQKILDEAIAKGISYHSAVLEEFVKYFGFVTGVARFAETFRLVYLLRTPEDVERELGMVLEIPSVNSVTNEFLYDNTDN